MTVTVYCASSSKVDVMYTDAAANLGKLFSEDKIHCLYGAGQVGLMGSLADAIIENQGEITGVIPQFMIDNNWHHKALEKIIITKTMHERKAIMAKLSDASVALPGGCGTLEELLEIITWKQLGLYSKPIVIVNINGYFNPMLEMLNKAVEELFMKEEHKQLWVVVDNAEDVLPAIKNAPSTNNQDFNFAVV